MKKLNKLLSRHQLVDIPEDELEEQFVRGLSSHIPITLSYLTRVQVGDQAAKRLTRPIPASASSTFPQESAYKRNPRDQGSRTALLLGGSCASDLISLVRG